MAKFFGKFDQLLIYASFVQKILIFTQSKFNQFGESLLLQNKRKKKTVVLLDFVEMRWGVDSIAVSVFVNIG